DCRLANRANHERRRLWRADGHRAGPAWWHRWWLDIRIDGHLSGRWTRRLDCCCRCRRGHPRRAHQDVEASLIQISTAEDKRTVKFCLEEANPPCPYVLRGGGFRKQVNSFD